MSSSPPSTELPVPVHDVATRVVALADQCVKCGLCQPHCPTYAVARTEAESPRGRIALAKALALGAVEATSSAARHLDQCLACRRCERVCPSQVRYGELIVAIRALVPAAHTAPTVWRRLVLHPRLLRAASRLTSLAAVRRAARSTPLRALGRRLGLERLADELPALPAVEGTDRTSGRAATRGRIGLFLGCVAAETDRDVHAGAQRLLQALGYAVVVPRGADCCGALALHGGDIARAARIGRTTRERVAAAGVDTLLVSASGCFGTLRDALAGSGVRVREIHEFLAADERFAALRFRALPARALLHMPCTQTSVARAGDAIRRVLRHIPQLDIAALPDAPGCCGAAGDYFLRHPDIADALRERTLAPVDGAADLLITSNAGCRIFLGNGLRRRGAAPTVTHPVALLAAQLEN